VWAIDVASAKASEQISIALFPNAPPGSTPNALAVSPDGQRMLVANADNNTVAVVDISTPGQSRAAGFIPTGWYPTGVLYSRDGSNIFILAGKGLTSEPNPRGPQPGIPGASGRYTGSMLEGALSIVPTPSTAELARLTRIVYDVTPYSDATRLAPAAPSGDSAIPRRVGDPSPIKHVFYIIRENRTYDQILGDLDRGNGDPTLALFGQDVTPNAHALAREFVTLDNFYVDAEVSYDGHAFSTGAYATDVVEKIWPVNYGSRGGVYLSEGGGSMRTQYGNLAAPPNGYIWDACTRAGVSVRSYGEFVARDTTATPSAEPSTDMARNRGATPVKASVPGLVGHIHPTYPPFDLSIRDNARVDIWLDEFHAFEKNGQLPGLSIIRLGGDHTDATRAGSRTPRAMIAENDLALGRIVEAISQSQYWQASAVFILEDDAQNGPDHVDAHRSPAFVASPYVRRGTVDSTLYTTSGVLRTMEMILGLPPMTQYDAAAAPLYGAFQSRAVTTPFMHQAARMDLEEMNRPNAPGAQASARMNLQDADLAPEGPLNEILWQSVHGAGSVMPPPVHAAFVRPGHAIAGDADDDR
jgi:YVTN family beta-propeller protein